MTQTITIGTRGSQLALWQAEYVRKCLNSQFPDLEIALQIIKTTGDRIQNRSLVGLGKGVFTREIESALLDETIDLAVHSMKDLPTKLPDGLCIGAIPSREDPRDVLVSASGLTLEELPENAQIGTTSPRRRAQLNFLRPDLSVVGVRGNLDTRLRKLQETDLDGLILAAAGINRLVGEETITEFFEVHKMVPAPGQGALGIEIREDDGEMREFLRPINDGDAELAVATERAVLSGLGGGCQVPIGVHASIKDGDLEIVGMVADHNGKRRVVAQDVGSPKQAASIAERLGTCLLSQGARELLSEEDNE
ncbi:MAG: hydroxymethylbilane synthase [Candidatus Poribacteria bacterium]|nr:hydroxymethylbilane synthase [Candidatus Poribacteria bacterium]